MRSSSNPEARPLAFSLAIEIFQKESITVVYKTVKLFFKMADVDLGQHGASGEWVEHGPVSYKAIAHLKCSND